MPSTYIPFTEEQKEQARTTDLVSLLRSLGETLKRSGKEYEWRDGSEKVTVRGNLWYHQYDREGGDAIAFVKRFFHKSYPEAVSYLLGDSEGFLQAPPIPKRESVDFHLPVKNDNMRRAFAYLMNRRGIDRGVIDAFAHHKMIYESAKYHNVVFVGYDKDGKAVHANMRGTGSESTFKGNAEGSIPEYSFHWSGVSEKLYLFEAPIDMLSFISMNQDNWRTHSYAAACCTSDRVLFQMLEDHPNISHVFLCYDNDGPGRKAAERTSDKLFLKGIKSEILAPRLKDWNEDLLYPCDEGEVEETCQVFGQ